MKLDFIVVTAGGWQGIYLNNKLVTQGMIATVQQVFKVLAKSRNDCFIAVSYLEADADWLSKSCELPQALESVKLA